MNEFGKPIPDDVESGEMVRDSESRFGDKEKIVEAMLEGSVEVLGDIDDLIDGVSPHENEAKMARVSYINANAIQVVKVQSEGDKEFLCIFKPYSGESPRARFQDHIKSYYPRECAAYLVSEHFGFDVVPPTVIREIDGQPGALQLFLPHEQYADYAVIFSFLEEEQEEELSQTADFQTIAALDWVLANADRNPRNMMFKIEQSSELFAIDHGVILNSQTFAERTLRGPARSLTWDNVAEKPLGIEIPDHIIEVLHDGYERKDELTKELVQRVDGPEGVSEEEIDAMWRRVKLILEKRVFLSPKNYPSMTGKPLGELESGLANS